MLKNSNVVDIREAVRYTRVEFAKFDVEETDDDSFYSKRCSEKEQPSLAIVTQTSKTVTSRDRNGHINFNSMCEIPSRLLCYVASCMIEMKGLPCLLNTLVRQKIS